MNNFHGKLVKNTVGLYFVDIGEEKFIECHAKGSFRKDKISPMVGDNVVLSIASEDNTGYILSIDERKNSFVRPNVSNVDLLIVVVASTQPNPDLFVLDKICAVATYNNADILLIFNKCDLKNADELKDLYTKVGIDSICLSALSENLDTEKDYILKKMQGVTSFFTGASGVGKTSLINSLFPTFELKTGELSKKIERGKHTTRHNELYKINDSTYIGDTPGFGMLEIAEYNLIPKEELLPSFPDIEKYAYECKYSNCSHTCEDGCNVIKSLKEGLISQSRHESFVRLFKELKKIKDWEINK